MMSSPFKESLLVPVSFLIQKKKKTDKKTPMGILSDKRQPADIRLKYFDNFVKFSKDKGSPPMKVITRTEEEKEESRPEYDIKVLVRDIPDFRLPLARAILEFMTDSKKITWDRNFQVALDGHEIHNSDIREILKYILGLSIVTSAEDIPTGAEQVKEKLRLLDIPLVWLKNTPHLSSRPKRPTTSKEQTGKGKKWIIY